MATTTYEKDNAVFVRGPQNCPDLGKRSVQVCKSAPHANGRIDMQTFTGQDAEVQATSLLWESGKVAHHSGIYATGDVDAQLRATYGNHTVDGLQKMDATLVSLNPPMWVVDANKDAHKFVQFAERLVAEAAPDAFHNIDNPGSYVCQERLHVPKRGSGDVLTTFSLCPEMEGLNTLIKCMTGLPTTFLDDQTKSQTVSVKRYRSCTDSVNMGNGLHALERLHIDRNRERDSGQYRAPMRLTMLLSYDDFGATHFPFAEPLNAPSSSFPEGVQLQKGNGAAARVDLGSVQHVSTLEADSRATARTRWKVPTAGKGSSRGLVIGGRPGRLLIWASSGADPQVPLFSALHQASLFKQDLPTHLVENTTDKTTPIRKVTVIGWDGKHWEISGRHECLEYEDFETRASFFGRTIDEEVFGVIMTGGPRAGEACAYAERLARQRMTTIDRLVRDVRTCIVFLYGEYLLISVISDQCLRSYGKVTEELSRSQYQTGVYAQDADAILNELRRVQLEEDAVVGTSASGNSRQRVKTRGCLNND